MLSLVFKYIFFSLELRNIYDTQGPRKEGFKYSILNDLYFVWVCAIDVAFICL